MEKWNYETKSETYNLYVSSLEIIDYHFVERKKWNMKQKTSVVKIRKGF